MNQNCDICKINSLILIFKNVFTGGYTCSIDNDKPYNERLAQTTCVATIAKNFTFSLPTISKHLKELKDAYY